MTREEIQTRMLDGRPFTYDDFSDDAVYPGYVNTRLVSYCIQRLRHKGMIAYERRGIPGRSGTRWAATQPETTK